MDGIVSRSESRGLRSNPGYRRSRRGYSPVVGVWSQSSILDDLVLGQVKSRSDWRHKSPWCGRGSWSFMSNSGLGMWSRWVVVRLSVYGSEVRLGSRPNCGYLSFEIRPVRPNTVVPPWLFRLEIPLGAPVSEVRVSHNPSENVGVPPTGYFPVGHWRHDPTRYFWVPDPNEVFWVPGSSRDIRGHDPTRGVSVQVSCGIICVENPNMTHWVLGSGWRCLCLRSGWFRFGRWS